MNELDINRDNRVEFEEFMRPTAKKFKEEQELERGADADRYWTYVICSEQNDLMVQFERSAFEHFDKDFNSQLTPTEVETELGRFLHAWAVKP